jgi:hypothetical protein
MAWEDVPCECPLIRQVRGDERVRVRADEDLVAVANLRAATGALADLREKVKALPRHRFLHSSGRVQWVRLDAVLALFDLERKVQ